jgi:23S rRNA-intervening sequence protein
MMQTAVTPIVQSYRDLIVWKKSMSLVLNIYRSTNAFPKTETYGLV